MREQRESKRNEEIKTLTSNGVSYAEIGRKYGLSRERVRQICSYETKDLPFDGVIPTTLSNVLLRKGIKTREQLIEALEKGITLSGISDKGLDKLSEWTGKYVVGHKRVFGKRLVKFIDS